MTPKKCFFFHLISMQIKRRKDRSRVLRLSPSHWDFWLAWKSEWHQLDFVGQSMRCDDGSVIVFRPSSHRSCSNCCVMATSKRPRSDSAILLRPWISERCYFWWARFNFNLPLEQLMDLVLTGEAPVVCISDPVSNMTKITCCSSLLCIRSPMMSVHHTVEWASQSCMTQPPAACSRHWSMSSSSFVVVWLLSLFGCAGRGATSRSFLQESLS